MASRGFRDGPLRYRAPEEIRYATGRSALGPILVALSEEGVVAIVIRDKASQLLAELDFRKAKLVHDREGCRQALRTAIDYVAAPFGRFPLPLDLRGTAFQKRVWKEVRRIPIGESASYTKIANAIGAPKAIRAVASSCARCRHAFAVPCHRVLHKGGGARDPNGKRRLRWVDYERRLQGKRAA